MVRTVRKQLNGAQNFGSSIFFIVKLWYANKIWKYNFKSSLTTHSVPRLYWESQNCKIQPISWLKLHLHSGMNDSLISGYHRVDRIKLGLPVSHDNQSMEAVMWKYAYIRLSKLSTKEFKQACDSYSKQLRGKVHLLAPYQVSPATSWNDNTTLVWAYHTWLVFSST